MEYLNKENEIFRETIAEKYKWIYDKDFKADLILSDDLDSLLSVMLLLHYRPDWRVKYFYSYNRGLYESLLISDDYEAVGVDLSLTKGKCISNHITARNESDTVNTDDLNLNVIKGITANTYFKKYNLNTLLLTMACFSHKLETTQARAISLIPDSAFLAHYLPKHYEAVNVQKNFLNELGYQDVYELQSNYAKADFESTANKMNSKAKLLVVKDRVRFDSNVRVEDICNVLGIKYRADVLEGLWKMKEIHQPVKTHLRSIDKSSVYAYTITDRFNAKYMKKIG